MGLDLSDLVSWVLGGRRAPSGIQRVQYEIAASLCAGGGMNDGAVLACAMLPAGNGVGGWRELPAPLLLRLRRLAIQGGADPREAAWQEASGILHDWLAAAPDLALAPGALLLCPGTAWAMPEQAARLAAAREAGARYVPLLHDTIPLALPEWCEARTVSDYAAWFSALPLLADGILCNSEATAADLRRFAARYLPGQEWPPLAVVPLNGAPPPPPREASLPPELESRPYALCTGTIEGRKNHLLLFQAWLTLARRLGGACPLLVCVGRPGWRSEGAMALLEASPELAARVVILPEVDDATLYALTRHCRFAVSASHGEGWGLPVSEALALGRPVLVPGHSALLESGAAGATFFTPNSEPDLVEKALALIAGPELAAARIAPGGGCRPWGEVAREMLARARALAGAAQPAVPPRLPPGLRVRLAPPPSRRPRLEQALAQVLPNGPGWLPAEAGARPSLPGLARLRCRVPEGVHGGALRLLLEVRAPAEPCRLRISAWRGGGEEVATTLDLSPGEEAKAMLLLPAPEEPGEDGVLEILLDSEAEERGAGLVALGLAREDVLEDRLRLIEGRELLAVLPD
ncbi:glycosyltransferase [Roseomonas gilardii subsp. gilardii]|uniref:glycosyltransferase n=1 Tax=Roseomonas gilardii TaxID=257708 RepID=UPI001FFAF93A|nr:glycosyltransferase [Roseomonas gilardii]UPG73560.1 glycosyltransferase [Roseomonas gilardii subsp. gilardii]